MSSLVFFFTLWMLTRPQAGTTPPPARSQNVVRICSLASGGSLTGCQDLDARLLEPAATAAGAPGAPGAGQRAFIDPETKALVEPNQDQLKELSVILAESMDKRQEEVKVQVLRDGTLRAPGGSFTVFSTATVKEKEKEKKP